MQRPAYMLSSSFPVKPFGNRHRLGIHFDHAVDRRPMLVDLINPRQILLREGARAELSRRHPRLQIGDAGLIQLKGLTDLETLLIGGTKVTDAGLAHLKPLAKLKKLSLFDTEIGDACGGQRAEACR